MRSTLRFKVAIDVAHDDAMRAGDNDQSIGSTVAAGFAGEAAAPADEAGENEQRRAALSAAAQLRENTDFIVASTFATPPGVPSAGFGYGRTLGEGAGEGRVPWRRGTWLTRASSASASSAESTISRADARYIEGRWSPAMVTGSECTFAVP